MRKFSSLIILTALLSGPIPAAFADSVSDRITVTVRGNGPDVVLIPGLTCSSSVWDATAKQLESHYRLHLVQVAGFAGSPSKANAQGPVTQPVVDAIHTYIKTNHLKSPRIIGHSLGGLMGMMLALQHPEDTGKLMVVDSLPFFSVIMGAQTRADAEPQAAVMRDSILKQSQEEYAQGETNFLQMLVKSPAGRKTATAWAVASDKSVVARAMYEVMTTDLRPKLSEIKTPVTMLYPFDGSMGIEKSVVDGMYQRSFAPLPHKNLVCITNSYHFIMLDQPAAFATQVDAFLK